MDAVALCSLILVMTLAAIGGLWPALATAILAFVADKFCFAHPYDISSIRPLRNAANMLMHPWCAAS